MVEFIYQFKDTNTSLISSVTHYSGSGTTPGNSSDAVRVGAGSTGNVARVYIINIV